MNRLLKIALLLTLLITGAIVTRAQTIIIPPSLGVMSSTQTSRNTATLSGNLLRTGGENPTVKIAWGTQDRGIQPLPDFSWDNEVIISTNQSAGTFSTNITIPAQGDVYYFRAIASNAAGIVVSRNLGVLLPTKIVESENLVGRWSFDDGDSNDSSGNGYHGSMQNFFTPGSISNLKLWLDASDSGTITESSGSVGQWSDKSGNGRNASQSTSSSQPIYSSDKLIFDGTDDFLSFSNLGISDPITLFMALRPHSLSTDDRILSINGNNYHGCLMFGSSTSLQLYNVGWYTINSSTALSPNQSTLISLTIDSSHNAAATVNGIAQNTLSSSQFLANGVSTNLGGKLFIGSTAYGNTYDGEFFEVLLLDSAMATNERQKIEGYLAYKWGLVNSLPADHPYKSVTPSSSHASDSPFSNSQSLDLSNGTVATVLTGGNEDVFDAGSSFSTSFWIKGWSSTGMNILSKSNWSISTANSGTDNLSITLTGAGGSYTVQTPINNGQWNHLITTYGGGYKKVYLNGSLVNSTAQTGTITSSNSKLTIGDNNTNGQSLKIDDLRIYGISLTSAEVQAIYKQGFGDIGSPKFSITSPSSILGTVGRSISYQIQKEAAHGLSGYDSTVTYELQNKPNWLSTSSSNGLVTGTPPEAGTYTFDVKASNTLGTATQTVTLTVRDYASWNYALSFTTDCPSGTTVDNWNMLVRLSENSTNGAGNAGFRYSQANANGGDLRFIDQGGQELKYEIANWNTYGESQVWVRVPSLTNDSNFTMLWGNSAATLPAYANDGSAWSDYFGVYHLEGGSGNAVDSSPANNVLTALNSPTLLSDGLSGESYTISGGMGFKGSITNGPSAKEGTYIIWTKNTSGSSSTAQPFGISFDDESAQLPFSKVSSLLPNLSGNGSWRQVAVIIKDGYFSYYMDGAKVGTSTWHFPGFQILSELALGRKTDANGPAGSVDEASFSTVARSAAWISASYNNQKTDQSSNPYLNFEALNGPVSLNDAAGTKIYGKRDLPFLFSLVNPEVVLFLQMVCPTGLVSMLPRVRLAAPPLHKRTRILPSLLREPLQGEQPYP